ncbi:hypothetical protein VKT23_019246 [Stygiomarasmius scandens]|uniref:BRCT domain-containing protein n=1 Tax=Marasmiellus scandens TaxID=2682957 RepID=A0ABR1IM68_9AGAR
MTAPSQSAAFDNFRGCSPTLNQNIGPRGTAHQTYKYYMIYGGPKAGVYRDQSLAAEVAQSTKQWNPKGFHDEHTVNENWMFMCQNAHTHSPDELRPFVSPFPAQASTQHVPSQPQTVDREVRDSPATTSRRNDLPAAPNAFSNAELIRMLTVKAAPFPHTSSRSHTADKVQASKSSSAEGLKSSGGFRSMGLSSKPPPVTPGSSMKQVKAPVSKSAAKPSLQHRPQKFLNYEANCKEESSLHETFRPSPSPMWSYLDRTLLTSSAR